VADRALTSMELAKARQQGDMRDYEEVRREPSSALSTETEATGTYRPRQRETLDLARMFADNGMEFQGVDAATGNPIVRDKSDGTVGKLDLDRMLADEGLDRSKLNLQYNTPSTALNEAPPDMGLRPTFRNEKGFVSHLKKSYEDVQVDPEQGIVVKANGTYYRADPSGWANFNPWELSRELVENLDLGVDAAATGLGAAVGGIPGALAGQAASTTFKTSLGRVLGTYEATPEEQLGDIALETAFAAGGYGLAAGAKPVFSQVAKALKKIDGSLAKEAWTSLIGFMSRTGPTAAETMVENPGRVARTIESAFKEVGRGANTSAVIEKLAEKKAGAATQMLEEATEALPRKYAENLRTMVQEAGERTVKLDVQAVARQAQQAIANQGLGKFVPAADDATRMVFAPLSEAEKTALGIPDLPEGVEQELKRLGTFLERYASDGTLHGEAGAQRLANMNKKLNELIRDARKSGSEDYKRALDVAAKAYRGAVGQAFADQGLGDAWVAVNKPYRQYADAVEAARTMLNSQEGVFTFADKLTKGAGKKGSATGIAKDLKELLGARGEELFEDVLVNNAAMKFAPKAPQLGIGWLLASGPAVIGAAAASSPRLMLKTTQGGEAVAKLLPQAFNMLEHVKGSPDSFRRALLTNPEALNIMMREVMQGAVGEEQLRDQLLQAGGVK
jgi:hypothetical protein